MNEPTSENRTVRLIPIIILGLLMASLLGACVGIKASPVAATHESTDAEPSPSTSTSPVPDTPAALPTATEAPTLLPDDETPPRGAEQEFSTDFSIHSVSYDEILSGGPPKDGIPALDDPQFVTIDEVGG